MSIAHSSLLYVFFALALMLLTGCGQSPDPVTATPPDVAPAPTEARQTARAQPALIDAGATTATRALYRNLHALKGEHVLFGHQDTMAYGVEWQDEPDDSDIKRVTGSFPAVYGWDLGGLERDGNNLDGVKFTNMRQWIIDAHARGGVNTLSWHMHNPVTGEGSWDKTPTVSHLLPGGSHHETLVKYLDSFVAFNQTLVDAAGEPIPLIFRPWHEHNGDWFWWGKGHTTEEDFIALWRFTVEYLSDSKRQHNLIYAYSPDRSRTDIDNFRADYLWAYPGDHYVDIIGLDNYWDLGHPANTASESEQREGLERSLAEVARIARDKNKLAAFTEGGRETIPEERFWTDRLLAALNANDDTREIVYVMVWRNANRERENREHYYAPYPGHLSADDFVAFYRSPRVLLEDGLPPLYQ